MFQVLFTSELAHFLSDSVAAVFIVRTEGAVGEYVIYCTSGDALMTASKCRTLCQERATAVCTSLFQQLGPFSCTVTKNYSLSAQLAQGYANAMLVMLVLTGIGVQWLKRCTKKESDQKESDQKEGDQKEPSKCCVNTCC